MSYCGAKGSNDAWLVICSLSGDRLGITLTYSDGSGDSRIFSLSKVTGAMK